MQQAAVAPYRSRGSRPATVWPHCQGRDQEGKAGRKDDRRPKEEEAQGKPQPKTEGRKIETGRTSRYRIANKAGSR